MVAFKIRRPWPHKFGRPGKTPRWHYRRGSSFITLAGQEYNFASLITVWHVEPNGEDALRGECRGTNWKWHIHHWQIQWCFLQDWRRKLLTRCEWCGGRSVKRDPVNVSHSWTDHRTRMWRGEKGLFHHDCSTVEHAQKKCLCADPLFDCGDYGKCALCGKFRGWRSVPNDADRYLASLPIGARIPAEEMPRLKGIWNEARS
ncbi:hypothetical protein [Cellulomonas sp. NPDC058312]|uniref:hypothetical protein n=1 Tax=Cellulomonas sp. NPDC058312 TaxID=3346441 RepID=UPI0036EC80B6